MNHLLSLLSANEMNYGLFLSVSTKLYNSIKEQKIMSKKSKPPIDPKDLMAVERATTALIGTAISLIVLGFIVEKFELFLHLISVELKGKDASSVPQLVHAVYYNYLGIFIVAAGIVLSLYTYRYYTRWVRHLQEGIIDTDRKIYLLLAIFVATVGALLLASMIIL